MDCRSKTLERSVICHSWLSRTTTLVVGIESKTSMADPATLWKGACIDSGKGWIGCSACSTLASFPWMFFQSVFHNGDWIIGVVLPDLSVFYCSFPGREGNVPWWQMPLGTIFHPSFGCPTLLLAHILTQIAWTILLNFITEKTYMAAKTTN